MTCNHKSSYGHCVDASSRAGPRATPDGERFGYYLTVPELKKWFGSNGFNVTKTRGWQGQVLTWEYLEWVILDGDLDSDSTIIWFPMRKSRRTFLMKKAEIAGYPLSKVVTFDNEEAPL